MKNVKKICGLLLACGLFALSFVVINDGTATAASNATVKITAGTERSCSMGNIDWGSVESSTNATGVSKTVSVSHSYTINSGAKCTVSVADLVNGSLKIGSGNIKITSVALVRASGTDGGNLNTTYTLNTGSNPATIYQKGVGEAGKGTQDIKAQLTVPAYTPVGTYQGAITITANPV